MKETYSCEAAMTCISPSKEFSGPWPYDTIFFILRAGFSTGRLQRNIYFQNINDWISIDCLPFLEPVLFLGKYGSTLLDRGQRKLPRLEMRWEAILPIAKQWNPGATRILYL